VFYPSDASSSRRTQAASVAYMFPPNVRTIAIQLRILTTARREQKIERFVHPINVPPHFQSLAKAYARAFSKKQVLVCDGGGTVHSLASTPPR